MGVRFKALVATTPRHVVTSEGMAITTCRVAEPRQRTHDGNTHWYTLTGFREVADVMKGTPKGSWVEIVGELVVRSYDMEAPEYPLTTVEIIASSVTINFVSEEVYLGEFSGYFV